MKLTLLFLHLLVANQELDETLSDIFDNEEARNNRLTALKDRISSLGGFDENFDAYYKQGLSILIFYNNELL